MPPGMHGTLIDLAPPGSYTVEQTVARVHESHGPVHKLALFHRWPVRVPRPLLRRHPAIEPLITGQRVLDTFFPVVKGGKAAIRVRSAAARLFSNTKSHAGATRRS